MNILFVTKGFPSESDMMTGNYEAVQARAIAARGHHVTVMAIKWKSLVHLFADKHIRRRVEDSVVIYERIGILPRLPFFPNSYKLNRWVMRQTFRKFCLYYLKENKAPDLVHVHSLFIAKYGILLKEKFGFPIVITEHWSGLNQGEISSNLKSEADVYRQADRVIVVSTALQGALRKYYSVESQVISNMVENRFFENRRLDRDDGLFKFVTVGRLVPIKRFDMLVLAFSKIDNPNVQLTIVGEGTERRTIENCIKKYGLEGKVVMAGQKSPEEVSNILCQSDCFVLSSYRETFGIVLIEAMAKGLPVISTRCGGPEDFVSEETGVLVSSGNIDELSSSMENMIKDSRHYDSQIIRDYCYNHFSEEVVSERIIRVYNEVLNLR